MASAPSSVTVHFMLDADAASGLLPRVVQTLARRDLIPDRISSERDGHTLRVEIAIDAMPCDMVHLVEGNLCQVVGVRNVARIPPPA
jgi:hypothetical protein